MVFLCAFNKIEYRDWILLEEMSQVLYIYGIGQFPARMATEY